MTNRRDLGPDIPPAWRMTNGHPEGDWVGVVAAWEMPNPLHGLAPETIAKIKQAIDSGYWKQNEQAANCASYAIAEAVEAYDIGPPRKSAQFSSDWDA